MNEPTQANDSEVAVIGAAMSGCPDLHELLAELDPGDFYSPFHQEIWSAIARVHGAGNKPDPISVRVALGELRFDPLRLIEMVQQVPAVAQAPWYAGRVADAAGKRRLQDAAARIQQIATAESVDLTTAQEDARQTVDAATRGRVVTQARSLAQILPDVVDVAQNGAGTFLSTGWPDVDDLIDGIGPGRLVVVAARPGVGKSLLGVNLARTVAHTHKHAVLFASIEMNEREVVQRVVANHAGVDLTRLTKGGTTDGEFQKVADAYQDLSAMPLRVVDYPDQSVSTIRREARNFQRVRDDLALIVVDYLQIMRTPEVKGGNRAEALGEVSRGLKLLARETGACVVAMAQVNRQPTSRQDSRPRASDLRESGSIEADADQVILLHPAENNLSDLTVIVDKNRHGPKGECHLLVAGHNAQLRNAFWSPSAVAR